MKAATFLENFGHLADAPGGIDELRHLILQLAVRGSLTEHRANGSASELVDRMLRDKSQKIDSGKIRKSKPLPPVVDGDAPFEIPATWEWVRIGDAMHLVNGRAFKPSEWSEKGLPIIRIQNLNDPNAPFNYCDFDVDKKFHIHNDDFLISWSGTPGTSFGAFIWNRGAALLNQHIFRAELNGPAYQKPFLRYAVNSQLDAMIAQAHGGVGLRHITKGKLERLCIPLPPLAEQHRIVAKVDELMALCDELEARQQERRAVHVHLNDAALDRLTSAENDADFHTAWTRVRRNFDLLYSVPENVNALRQAILQLAVQGKLVEQDAGDEPAVKLVERIETELGGDGKKGRKALPPVDADDVLFQIPCGWTWARFPQLGEFGRGKSRHRPRNDPKLYENGKYKLVQTGDVARSNGVVKTYTGMYNEVGLQQSRLWRKGTMCITIAANIADSGILGFDACIPDSVVGFVPAKELGDARYFEYFMRTAKARLEDFAPSTAQKNINLGILETVLIPLPPLQEMKRIVARVDQLLSLCDALETQLSGQQRSAERLTAAMVAGILEGAANSVGCGRGKRNV